MIIIPQVVSKLTPDRMGKSEREIIQDWFQNILKTWEKTNELEVSCS